MNYPPLTSKLKGRRMGEIQNIGCISGFGKAKKIFPDMHSAVSFCKKRKLYPYKCPSCGKFHVRSSSISKEKIDALLLLEKTDEELEVEYWLSKTN
jgi:hypothetical protein